MSVAKIISDFTDEECEMQEYPVTCVRQMVGQSVESILVCLKNVSI